MSSEESRSSLLPYALTAASIALGLFATPACRNVAVATHPKEVLAASVREELCARTQGWFENGWLSKPSDTFEESAAFPLAPLLVHVVATNDNAGADGDVPRPLIGELSRDERGAVVVDPSRPSVYFQRASTRLAGRDHDQWSFVWWYAKGADEPDVSGFQGVRMTLDESGFPLIWELLTDSSGARIVFVSSELEQAATEEFGSQNSGRNFSVERTVDESPDVVVAGLLESGSMPLGPFVYADSPSKDVLAMICRCSPSQVKAIQGSDYYDLAPSAALRPLRVNDPWKRIEGPGKSIRVPRASRASFGEGEP